jgi:hypothetical protein
MRGDQPAEESCLRESANMRNSPFTLPSFAAGAQPGSHRRLLIVAGVKKICRVGRERNARVQGRESWLRIAATQAPERLTLSHVTRIEPWTEK